MPDAGAVDIALSIEGADTRQQVAQREDATHGKVGQAERRGNILGRPAFLDKTDETFPAGHLVGIEPRLILDERGFDGGSIVPRVDDGAGEHDRLGIAARAPFFCDDQGCPITPASREYLEQVGIPVRANDQGLQDAARADGGQYVREVGLLAVTHIGLGNDQLVDRYKIEFHENTLL